MPAVGQPSGIDFVAGHERPYVAGHWTPGEGGEIDVVDPSTEEVVGVVEGASLQQFRLAVEAARATFDRGNWSGRAPQERVTCLARLVGYLDSQSADLLRRSVLEVGTPVSVAEVLHVGRPLAMATQSLAVYQKAPTREYNDVPPEELFGASRGGDVGVSLTTYEALGVVAAITAYNAPLYINLAKLIPALAAGNSVVLRPNSLTPYAALAIAEAADVAGLPAGVLSVLVEPGSDGAELLTTHPGVDAVTFTGSAAVGAAITRASASTLKRLVLELGGKSVQLFHEDSLDRVAQGALSVLSGIAGQGCSLATRMLVPESALEKVGATVAEAAAGIVLGDPRDARTTLGPVITAAQRERCERYVAAAVDHGAKVVCGGRRPADLPRGYFYEPTALTMSDHRNPAAVDEIFGPVLSIIGYRDLDHAIEIANDSEFGLDGIVHTNDPWLGYQLAARIRSGTVNVNGGLYSSWVSAGGAKMSGLGRERGIDGLRAFQHQKHILVQNARQSRESEPRS